MSEGSTKSRFQGYRTTNLNTRMPSNVFDHRRLRLFVGLIALLLPLVVDLVAAEELTSISASYHTGARDVFVGLLFVIAALMLAYNGHTFRESAASKTAAAATICIALFPAAAPMEKAGWEAMVHNACALILFCILAYFCFGPFRRRTRGFTGMRGRRARIYALCGWVIVSAMLGLGAAELLLPASTVSAYEMTYWAEFVALWAFGIAWITASKALPFLVDSEEALYPLTAPNRLETASIPGNYASS